LQHNPLLLLNGGQPMTKRREKEAVSGREIRIRDKHNHFLGKDVNGVVHIYCKRCGEFHVWNGAELATDKE